MTDTVIKAILKINPNAEVSVSGNDINTIQWHNGTTPISKSDIEAQMPSENDIKMENLRTKRDKLLKETDWEIIKAADRGTGIQQNLKDYRQALRDLPSNYTTTDGKSLEESLSNLTLPTR